MPVPRSVSLGTSSVEIEWNDGHRGVYTNRGLREACPCALCRGEPSAFGLPSVIPLTPAAPEGVHAVTYKVVGRYAVSFEWSDGHSTGIYPYDYLATVCECQACEAKRAAPAPRGDD